MKANEQSSPQTSSRFPYDVAEEMIRKHLASINNSDEGGREKDADGMKSG